MDSTVSREPSGSEPASPVLSDAAPPALGPLLWRAFRRAWRQPTLWLSLWLLNLAVTLVCALPLLLSLSSLLLDRPLADALARGRSDVLFFDLLLHGQGVWSGVGFGIVAAALLHWAIHVSLAGGLLPAMLAPGQRLRVPADSVLRQAVGWLGPMWRLEGVALLGLRLPLLVMAVVAAVLVGRGQRPFTGSMQLLIASYAPIGVLGLWAWSSLSLAIHLARLRLLTRATEGAAYAALKSTLRAIVADSTLLRAIAALGLVFVLLYVALIVVARLGAGALDYRLYVGLALLLRQTAAVGRSLLALTQLATAGELWRRQTQSEAQTRI